MRMKLSFRSNEDEVGTEELRESGSAEPAVA
jgi:hypothetical protein